MIHGPAKSAFSFSCSPGRHGERFREEQGREMLLDILYIRNVHGEWPRYETHILSRGKTGTSSCLPVTVRAIYVCTYVLAAKGVERVGGLFP